jgi:dipeptidyl aminopeptidase/acylaminoacyl peptidase
MGKRIRWLLAVLPFVLLQGGITGDDRPGEKPAIEPLFDALFQVRTFKETVISPDGKTLAWVESIPDKKAATGSWAIYLTDWQNTSAKPVRLTAGDGRTSYAEHSLAWSPDGKRIAFLSDREKPGQLQLYLAPSAGTQAKKLTNLTGNLAQPRWSPDGKLLAFLFTENATRQAGPVQPATPALGVIGENLDEQRLAVVDLESGKTRLLSPADLYVYEYDWSPDSKSMAAIAAHGSGDNNWYIARLYTMAVPSGKMTELWKPGFQIARPRWSPDGKTIALIGGLMSDEGVVGGDIFILSAQGKTPKPRNLTPGMKASASWLAWLPGNRILFTEHVDGSSGLAMLDPSVKEVGCVVGPKSRDVSTVPNQDRQRTLQEKGTEGITHLWRGDETIAAQGGTFSVSLSRDGKTCALIRHSFRAPPEVWAGPINGWKQITQGNKDLRPRWGEATSLHWKSGGRTVQGWLLYPRKYDDRKRYPLIVSVHGGPASAKRPAWPSTFFDLSAFSSAGYFVLFPNPRGSFGQGEEFTRANVKDFGHGDLRDILAGVDEVLKKFPVDNERLAVAGWSYGGYMTMWAVTQTNRFRAAIAGAGIANWQSYYGQNGIDQWLIPYFGASVYDDPAIYARSSPINFIKKVRTPTLILVGERDLECPVPQSQEFWHALKTFRVPTQFVVYPNEGHLIAEPEHRRDILRRSVTWVNQHLRAGKPQEKSKSP